MRIKRKMDYQLPRISNQKGNDNLHIIQDRLQIHKKMTFHVARHSFATLAIANGVPVENVSRLVGHTNIKTTQIYAHILKSTIEMQAESLAEKIR